MAPRRAPSYLWDTVGRVAGAAVACAGALGLGGHLVPLPDLLRPFGFGAPPSLAASASLVVLGVLSVAVTAGWRARVLTLIGGAALAVYGSIGVGERFLGAPQGAALLGLGVALAVTLQAGALALVASGFASRAPLAIASALTLGLSLASLLAFATSAPMLRRVGLEMPMLVAIALAIHGAGMLAWGYYGAEAGRPGAMLRVSPIVAAVGAATLFIVFAIAIEGDAAVLQIALVLGAAGKLGQTVHRHLEERRATTAAVKGAEAARAKAEDDVEQSRRAEELTTRLLELERQARREADQARERLSFIAEASRVLAEQHDLSATLRVAVSTAVPRLAELAIVVLGVDEGRLLRAAVAARGDLATGAERIRADEPSVVPGSPIDLAVRFGRSSFVTEVRRGATAKLLALGDATSAEWANALDARGCATLPLFARGSPIGALCLLEVGGSSRWSSQAEAALAEDYAGRAALAIHDADLHDEIRAALRARDEFLTTATQDLQMPLSLLEMQLESIGRAGASLASTPERLERFVVNARRLTAKLANVVEDLLDPSRITSESLTLDVARVDLASLTCTVAARFAASLERAGSRLILSTPEEAFGDWDRFRLEQVVANLLSNAIKYGASRPIELTVEADASRARICVRDRGVGMSPEQKARLFSLAERRATTRHYGGVGLGLYLVHRFVSAMGGTIDVTSEPARGSTFTVTLPRHRLGAAA